MVSAHPGGIAAGLRTDGAAGVDRRPKLTIGAAYVAIVIKVATCEFGDVLRWSQSVIDLAAGDPTKGANFAWGRRWRLPRHFAASPDIRSAIPGGVRTLMTQRR